MSPYLTYYIYLSCLPTLKEDRLLDKQEGSRSPEAFSKMFTRSRPVLASQKSGGIMKGPPSLVSPGQEKKMTAVPFKTPWLFFNWAVS